jgi:hypothetical protein
MNYKYLVEEKATPNLLVKDVFDVDTTILYLICYHIQTETKYPFLQILLNKVPQCSLIAEQFILPFMFNISEDRNDSLDELVLNKVRFELGNMNCDTNKLTNDMYKGIIFHEGTAFALVNVSGIDINGTLFSRDMLSWFALPSEIINDQKVCEIMVEQEVVELFTQLPQLGLLYSTETNKPYILPDAVYTGCEKQKVIFNSIFGSSKSREYASCGEYYYFYLSMNEAVKEAGWLKNGGTTGVSENDKLHPFSGRLLVDNDYGRYINGGINRYALFIEGNLYLEPKDEFALTDEEIDEKYPEPCIIIGYLDVHKIKPTVLVKEYVSFFPLSYHLLDKSSLGDSYNLVQNKIYIS